ncbi:MAG: HPr(Ser) kinase/phosphatase [Lactobacillus sp.]|jgi:HPr kinase/phosphorylase|nr:HPr(Ser) kinase/phosphatase [Lactobacillus sp.]MCI1481751.1 HPr(Ser) kinase/phosphatase [Lactobacillus sp.]
MGQSVTVEKLMTDNDLLHVVQGEEYLSKKTVGVADISRPGLVLTGYFDFYPHQRIQLFGQTEISYLSRVSHDKKAALFDRMCANDTPCFVVARNLPIPLEMLAAAKKNHLPVLQSSSATTYILSVLTRYLSDQLAPRKSIHGVLIELYGLGVLLTGHSGVGKSETALSLIKKGHRLIADDRVDVYPENEKTLMGTAPKILKHLVEIRGMGIINVFDLFGVGAVKDSCQIQLIINMQKWDPDANYDRLGLDQNTKKICGIEVPQITIPVKVGRSMDNIIEVAVMNFRAKMMGFDASKTFRNNLLALIRENSQHNQQEN